MEDDDDERFGDFTFAAPSTNVKINGPDLSFNTNLKINGGDHADDNDDDWGDFVSSPTVSITQSMKGKPPFDDPFGFASGQAPDLVGSKWVRPCGALPLSLFGEEKEEEEEEKNPGGAGVGVFSGSASAELKKTNNKDVNGGDFVSGLLNSNGLGLDSKNSSSSGLNLVSKQSNLIGLNGYFDAKQKQEVNGGDLVSDLLNSNGSKLDSNGSGVDLKNSSSSGLNLGSNQSSSNGDFEWGFISKSDQHTVEAGNGSMSDFGGFGLSWNVVGSDLNGLSSKGGGGNSDGNRMGLNFDGVISEGNGLSSNFKGVNVDGDGLSSNFNGVNAETKGSSLVGDDEYFGDDDGEWEFQDAKSETLSRDGDNKVAT